jgi:hypothetical protein
MRRALSISVSYNTYDYVACIYLPRLLCSNKPANRGYLVRIWFSRKCRGGDSGGRCTGHAINGMVNGEGMLDVVVDGAIWRCSERLGGADTSLATYTLSPLD